ncbi:DUF2232 domain-containing protein [Bradyrhizobium sp.]|uniref:DUF2232 domain-containing protein n=1 Tax=Bradyrhizobium sp. TaxID=376 RepID=UPI001D33AF56|nr:DUF2232 domain-containing protein [Bradyrhizobium sp.]MBV8697481.1 DUF2232 domain-containing protein [Bradyrhizobium sp.]MBV8923220.1 DUF2232 domain-containing protein [Bradyrhizobium sp.]MBV9983956.1 DUF2232 domain-containing protein [Bradyrhizobium sp.]
MTTIVLIALAAGCASALMFASIISGALISLVLLYLAPLPLMVAALSWGPLCGAIGGLAAAVGLGAIFGLPYCIAFAITVALPAWWLGHLVLLGRPSSAAPAADKAAAERPELEWYPLGRVLLWIVGFATLAVMSTLLTFGTDAQSITTTLRELLLKVVGAQDDLDAQTERVIRLVIRSVPLAAAAMAMTTLTLNLWLAGKITATSHRLLRPWPDLKSVTLPPITLAVLCVAIALGFSGGLIAILGRVMATALMMTYAMVGFAALHTLTLTLKNRAFWLGSVYAIVVLFVWPVLAVVVLGVADAMFGLRQRFLRRRFPPPLPAP